MPWAKTRPLWPSTGAASAMPTPITWSRATSARASVRATSSLARSIVSCGAWSTSIAVNSSLSSSPERSQTATRRCSWPMSMPTANAVRGTSVISTGGRPPLWRGESSSYSSTIPARSSSSMNAETVGRERPVISAIAERLVPGCR